MIYYAVAVNVKSVLGHGSFHFWFVIFFGQFISLKLDSTGRAFYTPGTFSPCPKPGHTACLDQYPGDGNMQFTDSPSYVQCLDGYYFC